MLSRVVPRASMALVWSGIEAGEPSSEATAGMIANTPQNRNLADLDYLPPQCPPAGGKVPRLSDEEKRSFVRWIDLGCPIDLDYDPASKKLSWKLNYTGLTGPATPAPRPPRRCSD